MFLEQSKHNTLHNNALDTVHKIIYKEWYCKSRFTFIAPYLYVVSMPSRTGGLHLHHRQCPPLPNRSDPGFIGLK